MAVFTQGKRSELGSANVCTACSVWVLPLEQKGCLTNKAEPLATRGSPLKREQGTLHGVGGWGGQGPPKQMPCQELRLPRRCPWEGAAVCDSAERSFGRLVG